MKRIVLCLAALAALVCLSASADAHGRVGNRFRGQRFHGHHHGHVVMVPQYIAPQVAFAQPYGLAADHCGGGLGLYGGGYGAFGAGVGYGSPVVVLEDGHHHHHHFRDFRRRGNRGLGVLRNRGGLLGGGGGGGILRRLLGGL